MPSLACAGTSWRSVSFLYATGEHSCIKSNSASSLPTHLLLEIHDAQHQPHNFCPTLSAHDEAPAPVKRNMERYQTIEGIAKIETEVIQIPVDPVLPTGEKLKGKLPELGDFFHRYDGIADSNMC